MRPKNIETHPMYSSLESDFKQLHIAIQNLSLDIGFDLKDELVQLKRKADSLFEFGCPDDLSYALLLIRYFSYIEKSIRYLPLKEVSLRNTILHEGESQYYLLLADFKNTMIFAMPDFLMLVENIKKYSYENISEEKKAGALRLLQTLQLSKKNPKTIIGAATLIKKELKMPDNVLFCTGFFSKKSRLKDLYVNAVGLLENISAQAHK